MSKGWGWVTHNAREFVFLAGLGMVSGGLALLSASAALIVPGAILVWLAIPPKRKAS